MKQNAVIVVNDDLTQLKYLTALVCQAGLQATSFTSAEAALLALDHARPPDLIVTDIYMPGIDGWRFCRLLRSPEYAAFNAVPILVVSSTYTGDEASRITADLGANAFLNGPADGRQFISIVQTLLAGRSQQSRLQVLIVEDSASLAEGLGQHFEHWGYQAHIVLTCQAAREALREQAFDVALIDHHLPEGPGDVLLPDLQAKQPDCVCLMMTGDSNPNLALQWMRKGAAACLHKPFAPEYLIELCNRARRERALLRVQDLLELRTRELRSSEYLNRITIDAFQEALHVVDADLRICRFNRHLQQWCEQLGLPAVTEGQKLTEAFPFLTDDVLAQYQQVFASGQPLMTEEETAIDGRCIVTSTSKTPIQENGRVTRVLTVLTDITARCQAEKALQDSHHFLESILNSIQDGISVLDTRFNILTVNQAMRRWYDHKLPLENRKCYEAYQSRTAPCIDCPVSRSLESGQLEHAEVPLVQKDGLTGVLELYAFPMFDSSGKPTGFIEYVRDISARKQAEAKVEAAHQRLLTILDSMKALVYVADMTTYKILFINRYGRVNYGYTDGARCWETFQANQTGPCDFCTRSRLLDANGQSGGVVRWEQYNTRTEKWLNFQDLAIKWIDGRIARLTIAMDITERKQAEAIRHRVQKAESLERMAGAVAHHYNNLLMAVMGNLEIAMDMLPPDSPPREMLTEAHRASQRAAEIGKNMLAYLGQTMVPFQTLDLAEICRQSLVEFERERPQSLTLTVNLPTFGLTIQGHADRLRQVINNLLSNAQEAVASGSHQENGRVTVSLTQIAAAAIPTRNGFPFSFEPRANTYACLEVCDNGCGITPIDRDKLFDPFYSTKFTGRGLGLSVALGIIKAHGGCMVLADKDEPGAAFQVFLPLAAAVTPAAIPDPKTLSADFSGQTVLVVDDEPAVRKMAATMLTHLGLKVLEAADGQKALNVFNEHHNTIQCVLCDLTMPGLNGWQTLEALRRQAPELPVILASGYDLAHVMDGAGTERPQAYLSKPYSLLALKTALIRAMASHSITIKQCC